MAILRSTKKRVILIECEKGAFKAIDETAGDAIRGNHFKLPLERVNAIKAEARKHKRGGKSLHGPPR